MKILKFPHPDLLHKCPVISVFDKELKIILDSMWETMKSERGIGLAANQVGILLRMFVMDGPEGRLNVVNPKYLSASIKGAALKEGCLSFPGEFIIVPGRSNWIHLAYQDENGQNKEVVLEGIYAVCAQHEIDHLDGKVFIKHESLARNIRKQLIKKWK